MCRDNSSQPLADQRGVFIYVRLFTQQFSHPQNQSLICFDSAFICPFPSVSLLSPVSLIIFGGFSLFVFVFHLHPFCRGLCCLVQTNDNRVPSQHSTSRKVNSFYQVFCTNKCSKLPLGSRNALSCIFTLHHPIYYTDPFSLSVEQLLVIPLPRRCKNEIIDFGNR